MQTTASQPIWLWDDDAAAMIGVTVRTLANWRCRRFGPPFYKLGRRARYIQAEVEEWILAQRVDTSPVQTSRLRRKKPRKYDLSGGE